MTHTIFNSWSYTIFGTYNYIGTCILSIQVIQMPHKILQYTTEHIYNHSDTLPLFSFILLVYTLKNWPANFLITRLHILMSDLFIFLFSYVPVDLIRQRRRCVGISLLTDSQVIWIKYILDTNLFLGNFSQYLNTISEFEIWLIDIFRNYMG